jgi:hypothetical protein
MIQTRSKAISFIFDNSLLPLAGTAAAVVWANLDVASYDGVAHPTLLGQRRRDGVLLRARSEGGV